MQTQMVSFSEKTLLVVAYHKFKMITKVENANVAIIATIYNLGLANGFKAQVLSYI